MVRSAEAQVIFTMKAAPRFCRDLAGALFIRYPDGYASVGLSHAWKRAGPFCVRPLFGVQVEFTAARADAMQRP
ncbi:hypothetical protein D9M69_453730 [compost metagenome]